MGFFVFWDTPMTLAELLASTDNRKFRWGIKRASAYVSSFSGCLSGGACPASLLGVSGEQWAKCLKDAELAAVYANPAMVVKSTSDSDLPDGAILSFENILTSTRKDRDGDILESAGCTLDPKMPLLWQHLSMQPIGKLLKEVGRTKNYVKTAAAIADTALGRDAAILTKFGALRISHGFQPTEYEPMEDDKGNHEGWRISKFSVYELSLVSIPSNVDAEILSSTEKSKSFAKELDAIRTVYGRGNLETDAVKQWAKHFHENRPVQGKGVSLPGTELETLVTRTIPLKQVAAEFNLTPEQIQSLTLPHIAALTAPIEKHACTCQTKTVSEPVAETKSTEPKEAKMYGEYHLAGSFEAIQCSLHRTLKRHMLATLADMNQYDYCYVAATFPDHAIVCVEDYPETECYRVQYEMDGDEAKWVGQPAEVEVVLSAEVMDAGKARQAVFTKDEHAVSVEQKCFAELLKNPSQMRAFRDQLDVALEANRPREWADMEGVLDALLGATA